VRTHAVHFSRYRGTDDDVGSDCTKLTLVDGELTKVPYTDIDRPAKANNPKTWHAFDEAARRWEANPNGWAGIGYEFAADDSYTGIDLDACLDPTSGRIADWADAELALLLPTYAEISPSGKGIKLWVETEQAHTGRSQRDTRARRRRSL
jgi:primase-polymerase (primpol)-like protein